jgi:hypothetical protein
MAEMLMQNNQQPQGQMVSGRYVAPSFFQNILPLVNMYQSQRLAEKADTKAAQLAEAIRGRNATEAQDIIQTLQGTSDYKPAIPYPTKPVISESSDLGPQSYPAIENQVGQAPNQPAALMKALRSSSPIGQMVAGTLINKSLEGPKEFNLGIGETRYRQGPNGEVIQVAQGKNKEIEQPAEIKLALSLDRSLPRDPATWTQADADKANAQILKHIRETRPVNINNTTVLGGESEYNKTFGKGLATQDMTLIEAARSAPQILANNQRQLDLLKSGNVITGVGANQRLDLARFGQAIGVGGKGDIVANTQQLLAGRAGSVLDSIKASGLGAGNGFSNADRDFLEKAKLGGIAYDATALKRQLEIENNVTKAMVSQYNQRIKDMPVAGNLKLQPVNVGNVEYLGPVK